MQRGKSVYRDKKKQGRVVLARTNFPRCWERLASNHPEDTAGQLETTFREKWEECYNCKTPKHRSSCISLQKAAVNVKSYNPTYFKNVRSSLEMMIQTRSWHVYLIWQRKRRRELVSLFPFFVCLPCRIFHPSTIAPPPLSLSLCIVRGSPTFSAIVAVKYDTHMHSGALKVLSCGLWRCTDMQIINVNVVRWRDAEGFLSL